MRQYMANFITADVAAMETLMQRVDARKYTESRNSGRVQRTGVSAWILSDAQIFLNVRSNRKSCVSSFS